MCLIYTSWGTTDVQVRTPVVQTGSQKRIPDSERWLTDWTERGPVREVEIEVPGVGVHPSHLVDGQGNVLLTHTTSRVTPKDTGNLVRPTGVLLERGGNNSGS